MKIFFETNQGIEFDMEVDDIINSLQQIKERIQTQRGFPVSKQTLSFNGRIIGGDAELLSADIEDGSIVHLHISDDEEDDPMPPPPPPQDKLLSVDIEDGSTDHLHISDDEEDDPMPPPPPQDELLSADIEDGSTDHLRITDDEEDDPMPPPPPQDELLSADIEDGSTDHLRITDDEEDDPMPPPPPQDELLSDDIEDGSTDHLRITDDEEDDPIPPPPPPPQDMTIALKIPPPINTILQKVVATDKIKKLRRRAEEAVKGTPEEDLEIVLFDKWRRELPDNMTVLQCELLPHSEVTVQFQSSCDSSTPSGVAELAMYRPGGITPEAAAAAAQPAESQESSSTVPGNRISVEVKYRERRMTVGVWADQEVRHLRKRLQRVDLPEYFFTHNQAVLEENLSFAAQNILDGDLIEILPGHVS